jgi:hypothetical protein
MPKLGGSRPLVVSLLVLLPVLDVSALLPCSGQKSGRDKILIDVSSGSGCVLEAQDALPGFVEPDSKLLLRGSPFAASQGASSAAIQRETPPVFDGRQNPLFSL